MPDTATVFGFVVLTLLIAVAVPAAVSITTDDATVTYDLDIGETETVTEQLVVIVQDSSKTDAEITLRDDKTLDSQTETLNESETQQYTVSNETVNVTLQQAGGAQANATVAVDYPRTYGWSDGAKTVVDNLPLMLVAAGGLVVIGGIGAFTRRF